MNKPITLEEAKERAEPEQGQIDDAIAALNDVLAAGIGDNPSRKEFSVKPPPEYDRLSVSGRARVRNAFADTGDWTLTEEAYGRMRVRIQRGG